jgi:hypothetical protein
MQTFSDPASPRNRLRIEQLPKGFIKFPGHIIDGLEKEQARLGCRFSADYARQSLERHTLAWYYEGLPVAYRTVPDGIEVLAIGWEETARYSCAAENGVRVVQP